ncbi:MAG: TetR/AcrR family transcriptional regulator [Cellulomonas iranensis]|uniref:TetR/AcrR family transcriptional regulator n=1 Tax=Cellulomonas iranensis TaxID=76862 RepID=UPI001B2CB547|nr:TetR/AcrR family transcriptional regulator [Cellulomonas iranensis]MBO9568033.1 TetR/AcrR family transcriptional regulator [Cellulomonas iranensis]
MPSPENTSRPAPARGRPRDPRIDAAVQAAALEVLEERGYAGFTLDEVAHRAGTSTPAVRRRWRSRQHLVVDTLLDRIGPAPTPDTGCTHCDLIAGIGTLSPAFGAGLGRRVLPALVADLADDPELEAAFFGRLFHPRRASTAEALRRGVERGDIAPDADVDLLLDMLGATAYYRLLFGHLPVTPSLAEDVVHVVMAGVATDSWRSRHAHER